MLPETKRERAAAPPGELARFEPIPGAIVAEKYRVERTLGEGGMGLVVAATHLVLEQPVAIKFLLPEAMRSRVAVERFLREARVAAKVRSEHVARVHDVGTLPGGQPYIVMEHLVGSDLGQLIANDGARPIDEACEIALQACEALAEVHAAGIVHRDLKPSNLFVTRRSDGSPAVKLLDFGISKLSFGGDEASADPALTATATIMGSPSYMSPEQLKSTREVDSRADVWSLGTVLYEALTGKPAFRGESVPQVCAMIASEDRVLPSELLDTMPLELERALLGCLVKDPARRTTLVDLARTLAQFAPQRARPSLERIEAVLGVAPRSRADRPGRRPRAAAATAATSDRNRTVVAWGKKERSRRGRGGIVIAFLLCVIGVLSAALYVGRPNGRALRGDSAGARSAVISVASVVSSAVASALPNLPLPSALPMPTFDETTAIDGGAEPQGEADGDEDVDAATPAASSRPAPMAGAPSAHIAAKARPPPKTKHLSKTLHRGHP